MLQELQKLQPVPAFSKRLACALDAYFPPKEFWAPGRAWLRDAYCAEAFAKKTSAKNVGLISEARPDFAVEYSNGNILRFEATLADLPGRMMAREERVTWESGDGLRQDPERNWIARRRAIPLALESAAMLKAGKNYSPDTNLLIYLNLSTYDCWRDEIEPELVENTAPARAHFNSIWVLWSGRVYRTWPQPFLGNGKTFRPRRHQLGWAMNAYESRQLLNQVFAAPNAFR